MYVLVTCLFALNYCLPVSTTVCPVVSTNTDRGVQVASWGSEVLINYTLTAGEIEGG
jgi:hypothetical protein